MTGILASLGTTVAAFGALVGGVWHHRGRHAASGAGEDGYAGAFGDTDVWLASLPEGEPRTWPASWEPAPVAGVSGRPPWETDDQDSHRGSDQGRDVRVWASDSRPAAGADVTGALLPCPTGERSWLPSPPADQDTGRSRATDRIQPGPPRHLAETWLDAQLADLYSWVRATWRALEAI